jgi:hypothetical protein
VSDQSQKKKIREMQDQLAHEISEKDMFEPFAQQEEGLNDYITALSKSIVDMNRVLDVSLSEKKIEDAWTQIGMFRPIRLDHTNCLQVAIKTHSFIHASMKIHIPLLVVSGDALKKSNEMVLKTIDAFEKDMDRVIDGVVANTQKDICTQYIGALGQLIVAMRTMSSNFDNLQPTDKMKIPLLSATDCGGFQDNKKDMLTSVDIFEKALQTIKKKHDLLVGDKTLQEKEIITLKGALEAEKKSLQGKIRNIQLAADDLKGEKNVLIVRVASAENALEALQKKYDTEAVEVGKIVGMVAPPEDMPAAGNGLVGDSNDLVVRDIPDGPGNE